MSTRARQDSARGEKPRIIPSPHLLEWNGDVIRLGAGARVAVVCDRDDAPGQRFAARLLRGELAAADSSAQGAALTVYLVDWSARGPLAERAVQVLDESDRALLNGTGTFGQGYVIRMPARRRAAFARRSAGYVAPRRREAWLVGEGPQGLLYAAATLAQLVQGGLLHAAHVRDYPDFRYRAAARWLLAAEINRWAYDWGDGPQAYVERVQRKLDFCLRFKVNMVPFDGFGWTAEKFPGYARMMRRLNAYARERGIKLIFGGYGASYDPMGLQPQHNIGRVWQNRESYPWGAIYPCGGMVKTPEHPTLGTCRSNAALNELRAAEMEEFVRSVEPGALYLHHEDISLPEAQEAWLRRCDQCRARWPNDVFSAIDGGAGGMAHGMKALLDAVFSVRNADSGYDAARDCTAILVSPGYMPENAEQDWDNVLEFWSNVAVLVGDRENVEIGFREIFPHPSTGEPWIDAFRTRMAEKQRQARVFLFCVSGADQYSLVSSFNYPLVGTAALSGMWAGAEAMFNFNGTLHQEPLLLSNVEFSWNAHAPGHVLPTGSAEGKAAYEALMSFRAKPPELFGADGFFPQACRRLYGERAGAAMWRFLNFSLAHPRDERGVLLVPVLPELIFPLSVLWRILYVDEQRWSLAPPDAWAQRMLGDVQITPAQWQERLGRVWATYEKANEGGLELLREVLAAPDLRESAREDVTYLEQCLQVGRRFARVLSGFHALLASWPEKREGLAEVEAALGDLSRYLGENSSAFGGQGFNTVCPVGGDQASWAAAELKLRNQLMRMRDSRSLQDPHQAAS